MRLPFHLILITVFFLTPRASAATLHVPADYPTIQSCIEAATSGQDECVVAPGTYHELINFLGKAITLRSSHGPEATIIDGTGLKGSVVTCASNEGPDTVVNGFTITGGTGTISGPYSQGGGMKNGGSSPTVANCIFIGNTAREGGGMYNRNSNPVVTGCVFIRNSAVFGAGMFNGGTFNNPSSSRPTVTNCIFSRNVSDSVGGGMFNMASSPTVTSCIFTGNSANYAGGGMRNDLQGDATVINCTFSGNLAYMYGGGMQNEQCNPKVVNCTFSGNRARLGTGGAMDNYYGASPIVTNCVFWGDQPNEIAFDFAVTLSFCDLQGGVPVGAIDYGGNIELDPLFVREPSGSDDGLGDNPRTLDIDESLNDDYGDLRLQPGSPCINVGDPDFVSQPGETEIDGHARMLCGHVDMGAYEFGIGDYDCNQTIDLADFSAWPACASDPVDPPQSPLSKGGGKSCEAFDFDADGDVDLHDLAHYILIASP